MRSDRIERSCMLADQLRLDEPRPGFQRLSARFAGHAYDSHRHEWYAVGVTRSGIQSFHYRGAQRASQPGQAVVIYPDEVHDGHAGSAEGFSYRMLYIDPMLLHAALGHRAALPFVRQVVSDDRAVATLVVDAFDGFPDGLDPLATISIVTDLADILRRRSDTTTPGRTIRNRRTPDVAAVRTVRDLLDDATGLVDGADLERATGIDRFRLARDFRACVGTSPHRYLVGRRLLRARLAIAAGAGLAESAASAAFADQSHMTRHFKARYGVTPGRYAALIGLGDAPR